MPISSLIQLRAAARDWSKRQSVGDSTWDDMVTMLEVALNNGERADDGSYLTMPLRVRQMETVATITVTNGAGDLPADFLELINVRNPSEVTSSLDYVTSEWLADNFPLGQTSSNPANYSIIGAVLYCPIDVEIAYYARIPSLVADGQNWLLSAAPNVYLFGVLAFYSIYDKHPEAVAGYRSLRDNALGGLGLSDLNSRAGSFTRRASMVAQIMPGFAYGPWIPDVDDLNSTTAPVASGCLPTARGWGPWPSLSAISDAVGGVVRGAFMARTSSGSAVAFCGTATALYKLVGNVWVNVSRLAGGAYNLPADNYWTWAQQDKYLYAAQAGDVPQVIDIDAGANFTSIAALGATLFPGEVLGTPPTARYVATVGGFLFLLDLTAPVGSIIPTSGRIQFAWSGYRNPFFWKYGERSSDTGTLPSGGFIMGMSSPETGLLIQQNAVNRFVRVNDRRVWDFAVIESQQGTRSPYSIVEHQGVVYYYGVDGWIASNAGGLSIEGGIEVVDEWFKANANPSRLGTILGALDPTRPRIMWLFPTVGNSSYALDHIIGFDVQSKRFFHGPVSATTIFKAATSGTTLEGLGAAGLGYTMDPPGTVVPYSLDSDVWQGGVPQIGGFDAAQKLGFFSGLPMEALLRTGRIELIPGLRSYVNGWRPQTDAATILGRVAVAETPRATIAFGSQTALNPWGVIEEQASGRVMAFEATIPAGTAWTSILGGEFDDDMVKPDGRA